MKPAQSQFRRGGDGAPEPSYQAFLSYSHAADGQLAAFLQAALQRFAKPWYRRRAIRVFRDTTGLALTPDLWESIRAAVHASEHFILFASEQSARSRWIELELDEWLRVASADRLLIVLTDGELVWDHVVNDFDWARTTSLHPRLRGVFKAEPLHLDLRWARRTEDLSPRRPELLDSVARISATLRHLPLDDLFGEDVRQHRRTRRLAVSAISTLVLLLASSIVAARFAVQERNSAQRRLVELTVSNGTRAVEMGDLSGSALWFAEALRLDNGGRGDRDLHRIRLRMAVEQHPALQQVWVADSSSVRWATFGLGGRYVISESITLDYRSIDGRFEGLPSPGMGAGIWDTESGDSVVLRMPAREAVRVLAIHANAEHVRAITADEAGNAYLVDAIAGAELADLMHPAEVTAAEFGADGAVALTQCSDLTVRLWNVAAGKEVAALTHESALEASTLASDGKRVLTITEDGAAHIWTLRTGGSHGHQRLEQSEPVDQIAVSSDGRYALTLATRTARLFDLEAEEGPEHLESWIGVNHAEFSANSAMLLLADDFGEATVFTLDPLRPHGVARHDGPVLHASFSADNRRFATASTDRLARVWNPSGEPVSPPLHHEATVSHVAFDTERRRLVTVTADDIVRVWQLESPPASVAHPSVDRITFSADGRRVLTTGTWEVKAWDPVSGSAVTITPGSQVYNAELSPDGRRVLTATEDRIARVWDAATGTELVALRHNRRVTDARFSPDGSRIATAGTVTEEHAEVIVWDARSGERLFALPHDGLPRQIEFSHDGRYLLSHGLHVFTVWDLSAKRELDGLAVKDVTTASFSRDGHLLLILENRVTARLYDVLRERMLEREFKHENFILDQVTFGAASRTLLIAGGGYARVWDIETGAPLTPPLTHGTRQVVSRIFPSADDRYLVTLGADGGVRLWNARTGQLLSPSLRHGGEVRHAAFSPDAALLVTVGDDVARIWPLRNEDSSERDEQLALSAQLLAARTIDATGAVVPLGVTKFQNTWAAAKSHARNK